MPPGKDLIGITSNNKERRNRSKSGYLIATKGIYCKRFIAEFAKIVIYDKDVYKKKN